MQVAVIYDNNDNEITDGEVSSTKYWTKNYPEQSVTIWNEESDTEETYRHKDGEVYFVIYSQSRDVDYDSREKVDHFKERMEEYQRARDNEKVVCPSCGKITIQKNLRTEYDNYGIPMMCCTSCQESVREHLNNYEFNSLYAGEYLDEY